MCVYLNTFYFGLDVPQEERLSFRPNSGAFVGSEPAHCNLYITITPSDKERLLSFLTTHAADIAYAIENTEIMYAFRPNVSYEKARARLETGSHRFP
jgi:hypothetical protein